MKKILFIQGGGNEGYITDIDMVASLQNILGKDYKITYPKIHTQESEPDYGWTKQIGHLIAECENNVILMGHSFGASMILKYLSENIIIKKINGIFLMATPFWSGNEDWKQGLILTDNFCDNLPVTPIFFYHCKDDDEIPFSQFNEYKEKIKNATFRELETGGHQLNNDLSIVAVDIKSI